MTRKSGEAAADAVAVLDRPRDKGAYQRRMLDRPRPAPIECATGFEIPDRIFADPRLGHLAKLVAAAICSESRNGEIAIAPSNGRLRQVANVANMTVFSGLEDLEARGYIYRISRVTGSQREEIEYLTTLGYRCPWLGRGLPLPARIIVLLWRLPAASRGIEGRIIGDATYPLRDLT